VGSGEGGVFGERRYVELRVQLEGYTSVGWHRGGLVGRFLRGACVGLWRREVLALRVEVKWFLRRAF
jgi:hypothetical protein